MNDVWNLERIYSDFSDPEFEKDRKALEAAVSDFQTFAGSLAGLTPAEGLTGGITRLENLTALAMKLITYAQLRQSVNTRDTQAGSRAGQILQMLSATAGAEAAWKQWAAQLPDLTELVAGDEILREYSFYFENIRKSSTHLLGSLGEEIAAKLQLSGGNAWSDLQGYLTSTVPVSWKGGTTNLSAIRNLAYSPDPEVRKAAYEAELSCYDRIRDSVAFALNSIKLETISDCQLRKFASPLDRTLEHSFMKRETLEAMLGAMEEYMPQFRRYLKAKGKALGHSQGLPWYDLFAPMGNSGKAYTTQEAKDLLVELYTGFDRELADMVERAFDDAWIDFYPRDGKSGGAFCAGVESIGESRILTNFDGTFSDVVTLAHELGHSCSRVRRPLYRRV